MQNQMYLLASLLLKRIYLMEAISGQHILLLVLELKLLELNLPFLRYCELLYHYHKISYF